jgi:RNA polymerase sigma factor for flagellar operon FliA
MPKRKETPIDKLWKSYLATRTVAIRNKIVVHYSPLVQTHAARLARKLPSQVSYDEICSAAFDGLIEAVEAYDPERKAKFETFCQQRVSGAVMDWLRSLDPQSRTVRTFEKKRMMIKESMGCDLEFCPSQAEVARKLDMSLDRYDYLSRLSQLG